MEYLNEGLLAIFGTVFGLALQRYLDRAKPLIEVSKFGFSGSIVDIDNNLLKAVEDSPWEICISKYSSFEDLTLLDQNVRKTIIKLERALQDIESWLNMPIQNLTGKQSRTLFFTSSPFLSHPIIFNVLISSVVRGELSDLPKIDVNEELTFKITESECEDKKTYFIIFGSKTRTIDAKKYYPQDINEQLELLARLIAFSSTDSIHYAIKKAKEIIIKEVQKLNKIRELASTALTKNACPTFIITASNMGKSPAVLSPIFVARLNYGHEAKQFLMHATDEERKKPESDTVFSSGILDGNTQSNYINIAAEDTVTFKIVSEDVLGGQGDKIVTHYDLGSLEGVIYGWTTKEKKLKTSHLVIAKTISPDNKSRILAKAEGKWLRIKSIIDGTTKIV
ncbi:hypothetical protein ACFQNF_06570 [Iodobacter arcticus]|uniref:Uncharacterized protein n=1 Tax=Iodobacter arcticus TaxID=590593 RepID=A0ABW2QX45_9NEIS